MTIFQYFISVTRRRMSQVMHTVTFLFAALAVLYSTLRTSWETLINVDHFSTNVQAVFSVKRVHLFSGASRWVSSVAWHHDWWMLQCSLTLSAVKTTYDKFSFSFSPNQLKN